jgi:hypothetical protein
MGYTPDLSRIPLDEYGKILKGEELLPSWKILLEDTDTRLAALKSAGVADMAKLLEALKTKPRLAALAAKSGVPEPRKLADFQDLSVGSAARLAAAGIPTTEETYNRTRTETDCRQLQAETGLPEGEILLLARWSNLCRMRYVNHTFAVLLTRAGYDTLGRIAAADPAELCETLKTVNSRTGLFKGNLGVKDMGFLVREATRLLS